MTNFLIKLFICGNFKKFLKRKFVLFDLKKLIILTFYFFYGTISDNAKVCINFMEVVA